MAETTYASAFEKLVCIQNELSVPKDRFSDYNGCKFRTLEAIYSALKPLLLKYKAAVFFNDEIETIGAYNYIKTTLTFVDYETGETITTTANARECDPLKMTNAQATIATSSYARKSALSSLFMVDDPCESVENKNYTSQNGQNKTGTNAPQRNNNYSGNRNNNAAQKSSANSGNAPAPTHEEIPLPEEPPRYWGRKATA